MAIVHVSFDYPDSIVPAKTKAVKNLVDFQKDEENVVFSLNRTANFFDDFRIKREPFGYSMKVFGFPFGIGLRVWMYLVFLRIKKVLVMEGIEVCLIHGHKVTFEGFAVRNLASVFKVPYILTLRGDTDLNVIKKRRDLLSPLLKVMQKSERIIFLAPWTVNELKRIVPDLHLANKATVIPNIIRLGAAQEPNVQKDSKFRFVTVFNLDSYKRKNVFRVIDAFSLLRERFPSVTLDVIGSGKESSVAAITNYIESKGLLDSVTMRGFMEHSSVLKSYANYNVFILPSYPETFGLVFVEALSAGLPIIYAEKSGVDGFFDLYNIGIKVRHNQVSDISNAMVKIVEEFSVFNQSVKKYLEEGHIQIFSSDEVSAKYTSLIKEIL